MTINASHDDMDAYRHLRHYDDLYADKYLPAIVFVSVLMAMGIVGNSLVCFVYLVKFKPSTIRIFIVSLAIIDLMNCFISCPFDIADMRYRYTFGTYVTMCKMMRIFVTFTSVSSALILIPVAVDRYKKICRPLRKQMTRRLAKISISICCAVAVIVAAPAAIMYGPRTVTTDIPSINGSDCSTPDKYVGTSYPLIYNGANLTVFFTSTITLIILYSLIWRAIRKQLRHRQSILSKNITEQSSSSGRKSTTENGTTNDKCGICKENVENVEMDSSDYVADESSSCAKYQVSSQSTQDTATSGTTNYSVTSKDRPRKSGKEMSVRKTTFMLFLITLVFVLSYLPHLGLMATRALHKKIFDDINKVQFGAFYFFFKSYFINSAFNPIIYSFCNVNFRRELCGIFRTFRCKQCKT